MTEPDALYQVIPQGPVAAGPISPISQNDEFGEDSAMFESSEPPESPPVVVLSGTRWVMFMLGSAVLLPWNGV